MFPSQGVAVLGIALIAMGEEVGSEMSFRSMGHLVRFVTDHLFPCSFLYCTSCV